MKCRFLSAAEQELDEAVGYYEIQEVELGVQNRVNFVFCCEMQMLRTKP